jgi:hypothetical protein
VERGVSGAVTAISPFVRAMLWTTVATGVRAPAHGVCGDIQVRDDGAGVQSAGHLAWRAPALWDMLAAAGLRCATVAWPATAPATSWDGGLVVDDAFVEPLGPGFDAWPLLPDCVRPVDARDTLRQLRVHPGDISAEQLLALLPHARRIDQEADARLAQVAVALARVSTVHAVATHVAGGADWDFCAVAYPLLADIQRGFMRYRAPASADVDAADAEIFGTLVDTAYRLQDAMLGALLRSAGDDVTVVGAIRVRLRRGPGSSGHADRDGAGARRGVASAQGLPRRGRHRQSARDALVHGASVLDVAPTVSQPVRLACRRPRRPLPRSGGPPASRGAHDRAGAPRPGRRVAAGHR